MKISIPVMLKQICQPKLRSKWMECVNGKFDKATKIPIQYQTTSLTMGHAEICLDDLCAFIEDNDVQWADLTGDVRID